MTTGVSSGLSSLMASLAVSEVPPGAPWAGSAVSARAVAYPRAPDEAAEILGRCSEEGWTVLPAGAGGWPDGGGFAPEADVVVSTREMEAVSEYEPGDLTLTAGAGATLGRLAEITSEHGQWLAQDPPGGDAATLGAFVATGLPGPLAAGYGRPRDHVLGLTVITGDGRVIRPGGKVVKNVAGFDLVRLLTGSWGTLGLVAGATVRLYPLPQSDVTLLFGAPTPGELVPVARALATADVVPEALTLAWAPDPGDAGSDSVLPHLRPRSAGVLAARLLGSPEAVREKERILVEAAGVEPSEVLDQASSRAFFRDLDAGLSTSDLSLRISALPARLGEILERVAGVLERARSEGGHARVTAEATRGSVRVEARFGSAPGPGWAGELTSLRAAVEEVGGRLALLRGPRELLREVGPRRHGGGTAELMRRTRERFDPAGILVPGRLGFGAQGPHGGAGSTGDAS